jgi:predicted helicase
MFAQTVAYGLFSARAMGSASARFTLAEAARLIPKTNPFLRDFFDLITGPRLEDEPFAGFVRDLVSLLDHADMVAILEDFGKGGAARRDPVVHFYETFLQAYDPALRELRGVYYTPEPVVSYIVGSVDELLREKLGVKDGLSDKSKTTFQRAVGGKTETEECHRVLILDPAAGTGTFLFEVIERIREQFDRRHQAGLWPSYVREHLLPRLFGFELLMAPYAVAHFKIALELSARHLPELFREQWAYHFADNERLNIYLTNTLEDIEHATQQFGPLAILSKEANEATAVKKHRPVLVVLGNPPYSNYGRQNRNPWILGLLDDYKRGLKEKKLNLDDDFIKFLRWAHWRIERTGSGIVGFITNNVYLDGLTHRRLRESLLETFDEIHVLNLHGSSKKQETAPGGAKDENVFDITVGVAIVLLVKRPAAAKRGKKGTHAAVFHADLWGRRAAKYDWLWKHDVHNTQWTRLEPAKPDFLFVPRDTRHEAEYNAGWSLRDIFPVGNNGLKTDRDELFFDFDRKALERRMQTFFSDDRPAMFDHDYRVQDFSSYDIAARRAKCGYNPKAVQRCLYRPFDTRWLYYDPGLTSRPAEKVMKHILGGENVGLIAARQTKDDFGVLATASLAGHKSCAAYDINTVFPLYLYPDGRVPDDLFAHANGRRPNLAAAFVAEMERRLGMKFVADGPGNLKKTFGPEDVFHYLYAVLHSPRYRERYAEFLRTDFPRIPLTDKRCLFVRLCGRGKELVALHLLREDGPSLASFPVPGDARVEFVTYVPPEADLSAKERGEFAAEKLAPGRDGRVFINPRQYFEGVCPAIWQMRVGGYQVCERWLKDRRSRALTHDELDHYTRVVNALAETRRVMVEIDAVIADCGGWPLR